MTHAENALPGQRCVLRRGAAIATLVEPGAAFGGIADAPLARRADRQPISRAMARVAFPSAADSTICACCRSRYSVLVERAKPSSSACSSPINTIGVAFAMPLMQH